MYDLIYKFLENSIIISAAVILLLVLSLLLGNKTSPILRRTCWIFLALFFLIPVRPAVFTVSLPQAQEDSSPALASVYSQVRDYGTMLDMRVPGRTFESPDNVGEPMGEPGQAYEAQVDNKTENRPLSYESTVFISKQVKSFRYLVGQKAGLHIH